MKYTVTGRHLHVGTELRKHAEEQLEAAVEKFELRPTEAAAILSREKHGCTSEIIVHLSSGISIQSKASASDIFSSFDDSCQKLEKQLRRYKRRLKNHHHERTTPVEFLDVPSYVLESSAQDEEEADEPDSLQPVIIAEMETRIPTLSVGEAVLQLELADAPVLVFHNDSHGGVNVVYRRDDNNIGWIAPNANSN